MTGELMDEIWSQPLVCDLCCDKERPVAWQYTCANPPVVLLPLVRVCRTCNELIEALDWNGLMNRMFVTTRDNNHRYRTVVEGATADAAEQFEAQVQQRFTGITNAFAACADLENAQPI